MGTSFPSRNAYGIIKSNMEPKKDAWYSAYKNFLHLSYLLGFLFLVSVGLYITKAEEMKEFGIGTLAIILVMTAVWWYLAQLFKKRDKKAISLGYILLLGSLGLTFLNSGINIIAILFTAFFLYFVYRASKVPV